MTKRHLICPSGIACDFPVFSAGPTGISTRKTHARKIEFRLSAQADLGCPVPRTKILFFSSFRNSLTTRPVPARKRGAYRERHIRWAGDAVDGIAPTDERR
jgi:hypothetical protein